jgi:hypothetical protein
MKEVEQNETAEEQMAMSRGKFIYCDPFSQDLDCGDESWYLRWVRVDHIFEPRFLTEKPQVFILRQYINSPRFLKILKIFHNIHKFITLQPLSRRQYKNGQNHDNHHHDHKYKQYNEDEDFGFRKSDHADNYP